MYANTITKTEESEDGQEEERSIPYMKGYSVFNVEQIDGLPARYMNQAQADERTVSAKD